VDPNAHRLVCACAVCHAGLGEAGGRWRRVVRRADVLAEFRLDDARWSELGIPIEMAFFVHSSTAGRMLAFYPGPAGATESLLPLDAWNAVLADNPGFAPLAPDVEALLVRRAKGVETCHRISIDLAYELVGLLKRRWRGLAGGEEARSAVADFFARLAGTAERRPCTP
jgi:hypothetical protein